MTALEKKQLLVRRIDALPDALVDELFDFLDGYSNLKKDENGENDFEKYLKETNQKYNKVWEALS